MATTTTTTTAKPTTCRVCRANGFDNVLITFEDSHELKPDGKVKWNVFNAADHSVHIHKKQAASTSGTTSVPATEDQIQLLREIRDGIRQLLVVLAAAPK